MGSRFRISAEDFSRRLGANVVPIRAASPRPGTQTSCESNGGNSIGADRFVPMSFPLKNFKRFEVKICAVRGADPPHCYLSREYSLPSVTNSKGIYFEYEIIAARRHLVKSERVSNGIGSQPGKNSRLVTRSTNRSFWDETREDLTGVSGTCCNKPRQASA
jgi:hypothetical protein